MTTAGSEPEVPEQDARAFSRRQVLIGGGALAGGAVLAAGVHLATQEKAAEALVSVFLDGDLPAEDPVAEGWQRLDPFEVALLPQQMVAPHAKQLAVPVIYVRSMHNGSQIAFHIEWPDIDQDAIEAQNRFRDAVAVQMPVAVGSAPSVTMGQQDAHVHILHWKASWQADVDNGRQTVRDAFPAMYSDVSPEGVMGDMAATTYYPGVAAGNPMSARVRTSPVEELVAQGFGTLTHLDEQRAVGRGVYDADGWRVSMGVPMEGDAQRVTLRAGDEHTVSFAAWNGSAGNRGSRKQYANWTPITIGARRGS